MRFLTLWKIHHRWIILDFVSVMWSDHFLRVHRMQMVSWRFHSVPWIGFIVWSMCLLVEMNMSPLPPSAMSYIWDTEAAAVWRWRHVETMSDEQTWKTGALYCCLAHTSLLKLEQEHSRQMSHLQTLVPLLNIKIKNFATLKGKAEQRGKKYHCMLLL